MRDGAPPPPCPSSGKTAARGSIRHRRAQAARWARVTQCGVYLIADPVEDGEVTAVPAARENPAAAVRNFLRRLHQDRAAMRIPQISQCFHHLHIGVCVRRAQSEAPTVTAGKVAGAVHATHGRSVLTANLTGEYRHHTGLKIVGAKHTLLGYRLRRHLRPAAGEHQGARRDAADATPSDAPPPPRYWQVSVPEI